jgi:hypothetical protein
MSDRRSYRALIAGVMCVLALSCILFAGLAPFGHPRNDIAWLADQAGVRFGKHGTILSEGQLVSAGDGACSIEMLLRPSRSNADGTIFAFYDASGAKGLSVHQSMTHLRVEPVRETSARIYFDNVFRAGKLVFVTIVSGSGGLGLFVDGTLAWRATIRSESQVCSGNFVIGDSPKDSNNWDGEFRGLAIYWRELNSQQAMADYRSWAESGRPAERVVGKPEALYLFDERAGRTVHDLGSSSINLTIPDHYTIARPTMLETPWSAFEATWGYVQDVLINIGGFLPFGFTLAALLGSNRWRSIMIVVVIGFVVSLAIETLQASLPTRNSDFTDVVMNTLGTYLGAMMYSRWLPGRLRIFDWMKSHPEKLA